MRPLHPRVPARRSGHVHRCQPARLPLAGARARVHSIPRMPRRVSRLLLRRVQVRASRRGRRVVAVTRLLMEGSEAMAEAAVAAGCRFFAGYPMTPFTELLENFAKKLPAAGGVCVNAESELEAVGMAWGALATGARAATGSTGQGLSLMQESFSEITLAELPLVAFNMARGQGDYFQSTRGGGHGDYRHMVLAPMDIGEAVELTQLAFHLAELWRNPVLVQGDYLLAHTAEAVDVAPIDMASLPDKDWAVDGSGGGTGHSKVVSPLGIGKHNTPGPGIEGQQQAVAEKLTRIAAAEPRAERGFLGDAEHGVVAFGTPAK